MGRLVDAIWFISNISSTMCDYGKKFRCHLDFNGEKKILSLMFWMKVKKMIFVEKMINNRQKTHGNLCVFPLTCMLSLECIFTLNCTLFGKAFFVLGI